MPRLGRHSCDMTSDTRPARLGGASKSACYDRLDRGGGFNCQFRPKSQHLPGRPHCPAAGAILVTRPATQEMRGLGGAFENARYDDQGRGGGFNCQYRPKSQHLPGKPQCPAAGAILVTRAATQELLGPREAIVSARNDKEAGGAVSTASTGPNRRTSLKGLNASPWAPFL
jgi:hypothetical protein